MAVIPDGIRNMVETVLSYLVTILTILIIVKIIQLVGSIKGGGFNFGGGSGGGSGGGGDKEKKPSKKEKQREKFDKGMENPAYLRVWVRDRDDRNIQGAKVYVRPLNYKKNLKYEDVTNADGLMPSDGGYLTVPSQYTTLITVKYTLSKAEAHKSKQNKMSPIGDNGKFKEEKRVMLKAGDEQTVKFQLDIQAEYIKGFQPKILDLDIDNKYGKGVVRSTKGSK